MEFKELKEFIQKLYPIQRVSYSFDSKCIAKIEFNLKDGHRNSEVDIFYNKMLVSIQNMEPFYVEMNWHNEKIGIEQAIEKIKSCDILVLESDLQALRDADVKRNLNRVDHGRDEIIRKISEYSGKSEAEILKLAGL